MSATLDDGRHDYWLADIHVERLGSALPEHFLQFAQARAAGGFADAQMWPCDDGWPWGGIHLDFTERVARYWAFFSDTRVPPASGWDGWTFIAEGDRWELQLPYLDGNSPQPAWWELNEYDGMLSAAGHPGCWSGCRVDDLLHELRAMGDPYLTPTPFIDPDGRIVRAL